MTVHPETLTKDGKKQFAVLPYEELLAVQERLAGAEDLMELREAKRMEGKKASIPLAGVGAIKSVGQTRLASWVALSGQRLSSGPLTGGAARALPPSTMAKPFRLEGGTVRQVESSKAAGTAAVQNASATSSGFAVRLR